MASAQFDRIRPHNLYRLCPNWGQFRPTLERDQPKWADVDQTLTDFGQFCPIDVGQTRPIPSKFGPISSWLGWIWPILSDFCQLWGNISSDVCQVLPSWANFGPIPTCFGRCRSNLDCHRPALHRPRPNSGVRCRARNRLQIDRIQHRDDDAMDWALDA